jgi:hypothetical protein
LKLPTEIANEDGSAILELIGFGVFIQIPILIFALAMGTTLHQQLAIESIARHGVRAFTLEPDADSVEKVVEQLAFSFDVKTENLLWSLTCTPNPDCSDPLGLVTMQVNLNNLTAYSSLRFGER